MSDVDRVRVRAWKAGMEARNREALEEKRRRSPAERLRLLDAFLREHGQWVLARRDMAARVHRLPYAEVQRRVLAWRSRFE